jgi:molybdate transport system substrate-binding protein
MHRTWKTRAARGAIALVLAMGLAACSSSSKSTSNGASNNLSGSIQVFLGSSLTKAFTDFAKEFEDAHPGTSIKLNPGSSTTLAAQIQSGADADVFASADTKNMTKLQDGGEVTAKPVVFAKNQMEIAVEPGNPKKVKTVQDLASPNLIVVLCASEAPCGKYADQVLAQNNVKVTPKSRELDAASTLAKVSSGNADAAIVYVTDVKGAGSEVEGVEIPTDQNVVATLPIAPLKDSKNAALAQAWVDFVTAPAQEQKLQDQYGFLAPT